jgi:hypothetical protein
MIQPHIDAGGGTFSQQHGDDLTRRSVAEQLSQCLFVERDAVFLHQRHEIRRLVPAQRRSGEMRVVG